MAFKIRAVMAEWPAFLRWISPRIHFWLRFRPQPLPDILFLCAWLSMLIREQEMIACLCFSAVSLLKRETKQDKKASWMFREIPKALKGQLLTEARKERGRLAILIPQSGDGWEFISG